MTDTDIKNKLTAYYNEASKNKSIYFQPKIRNYLDYVLERVNVNKGVYTVLITLAFYKTLNPAQDIRYHKIDLPDGFSGRSFDTKYITPFLKEKNLPSMAESGWLTRSLEQDYPYDFNFNGKITPEVLKTSFLEIAQEIQSGKQNAENVLIELLKGGIKYREDNKVEIAKISSDDVSISAIIHMLERHFTANYGIHGGSKLPVLAFYAIYSILVPEMGRYKGCTLLPLGSHTASDTTSRSAGDIEVKKDNHIFEAVEVKLDKPITPQIVRVAYEKINKFGVERYYILSGKEQNLGDVSENNQLVFEIEQEHGCQVIINGLYQSLKYYLRLISNPKDFLNKYVELVKNDTELQTEHKVALKTLIDKYF